MAESTDLYRLLGLELDEPARGCPGEVDISVDEVTGLVGFRLDCDAGSFEVAMEPVAAYQIGFQLIDRALRACRGAWTNEALPAVSRQGRAREPQETAAAPLVAVSYG